MQSYACFNEWAMAQADRQTRRRITADPSLRFHVVDGHGYAARSLADAEAMHAARETREDMTWL